MTTERPARMDRIAHALVHRAALRAPGNLSERLEEEWLADMAERRGSLSRLRFAVGCCWATGIIAREQAIAALPATGASFGSGGFGAYTRNDSPGRARTTTLLLVVALHIGVFYAFTIGLGSKLVKLIPNPLETKTIESPHPRELPQPPRPQLSSPKLFVPSPEVPQFESEPEAPQATVREIPPTVTPRVTPPPVDQPVTRVAGGPGAGFPSANDYYPSAAIHRGEEGVATVRACVDAAGRLTSEPTIVQSTGSSRLDESALRLAKAGSGRYRASTENGRPVNSCYPFRIRFEIKS